MARLTPYAFLQEFDNNGDPLSGGKIYTYEAGTTTPKTTYTTAAGDIANPNPIILDSAGRADLWLGSGSYKFILKTSADVTLKTMDNLAGDTANAFGSSVVTISGNLAITSAYRNNVIISTAAATLSLQPAATAEDGFYFVIKNTSAAALVTIDPDTAELIDGASTSTVRAGQSALVICNGTGWNTIFLDSLNIFADSITTSGATGVVLKNSAGTTVATFGASAGVVSAHAGVVSAVGSIEVAGNSTAAAVITLAEDTDNGTNKVTITPPQTIASDYTLTLPSVSGTLATLADINVPFLHIQDQKSSGTAGGTFTQGAWQTRTLNIEVADTIGSTLTSNQFTLPAGTFYIEALAPAVNCTTHQARIQNITDTTTPLLGGSVFIGANSGSNASVCGVLTIASQKTFELQNRCTLTRATDGFGVATSWGTEVYAEVRVWKLA